MNLCKHPDEWANAQQYHTEYCICDRIHLIVYQLSTKSGFLFNVLHTTEHAGKQACE